MFEPLPGVDVADIAIVRQGKVWRLAVPIGFCAQSRRLSLVTSLMEAVEDLRVSPAQFFELAFQIEVVSIDGDCEDFATQDRDLARAFIPAAMRAQVLPIVRASYVRLIREVRPAMIYRVAKARSCLSKVLAKHDFLTSVLEAERYPTAETGRDPFGRKFWIMPRRP